MTKNDYSISPMWVNIISLMVIIPLVIPLIASFVFIWGWEQLDFGIDVLLQHPITVIAVLISGVISHQLIHGLTWQWLSGESNCVKYRIKWKSLTAYVHITRRIPIQAYVMGIVMPALVTGFLPLVMALVIGSGSLLMFGIIFTWIATEDMIVLWRLRNVDISALVEDHSTRVGAYVYETVEDDQPENTKTSVDTMPTMYP